MQLVKSIQYVTPDLGEDIQGFQDNLISYCETEAKHNAQKNLPNTMDELNAFIKNHIEIKTQEQIHQNQQRFLPICGMVIAKKIHLYHLSLYKVRPCTCARWNLVHDGDI